MPPVDFSKCECRHCAGHIEFPSAAAGETVACPHCSQPTELPAARAGKKFRRGLVVGCAALVVIIGAVAGMIVLKKTRMASAPEKNILSATNTPVVEPRDEMTTNGFAISAFKLEKTPGSSLVYVTGTVRNLNDKQRFGVKIVFSLLNTSQVSGGSATDYTPTLEARGTWKFKALVLDSKAAAATLNSIREDQ